MLRVRLSVVGEVLRVSNDGYNVDLLLRVTANDRRDDEGVAVTIARDRYDFYEDVRAMYEVDVRAAVNDCYRVLRVDDIRFEARVRVLYEFSILRVRSRQGPLAICQGLFYRHERNSNRRRRYG